MKAVVFHGIGDIRLDEVPDPMSKNISINMGNCNHRKYLPALVDVVRTGIIDPSEGLTRTAPIANALVAYESFDVRPAG